MATFKCIECGNIRETVVSDTRTNDDGYIRRTRKCRCGGRTHTLEVPLDILENYLNGVRAYHVKTLLRAAQSSIKQAQGILNATRSGDET